jgi:hypothetical protein
MTRSICGNVFSARSDEMSSALKPSLVQPNEPFIQLNEAARSFEGTLHRSKRSNSNFERRLPSG